MQPADAALYLISEKRFGLKHLMRLEKKKGGRKMLFEALLVEKKMAPQMKLLSILPLEIMSCGISLQGNEFKIKGCGQIAVNYHEK